MKTIQKKRKIKQKRSALVRKNCVNVMIGELIGSSFKLPFDDHGHDGTKLQALHEHGRPRSRMWCPDVIGRDGWVWVEQGTLRKRKFPPQGGGARPNR